jgi:hypothetical protein
MTPKQTAVEWLQVQLNENGKLSAVDFYQAKAMEKQQINEAFVECWKENMPEGYECKQSAEQYYNETFNTKKP